MLSSNLTGWLNVMLKFFLVNEVEKRSTNKHFHRREVDSITSTTPLGRDADGECPVGTSWAALGHGGEHHPRPWCEAFTWGRCVVSVVGASPPSAIASLMEGTVSLPLHRLEETRIQVMWTFRKSGLKHLSLGLTWDYGYNHKYFSWNYVHMVSHDLHHIFLTEVFVLLHFLTSLGFSEKLMSKQYAVFCPLHMYFVDTFSWCTLLSQDCRVILCHALGIAVNYPWHFNLFKFQTRYMQVSRGRFLFLFVT